MGYEASAATALVATHCAVCARPLVDAKSVELGIGPVCREKNGFDVVMDPEARAEANRLVYLIAAQQSGLSVGKACDRLRELGFEALAGRIAERVASVRIESDGETLSVHTPYCEDATAAWRTIPGRRWDKAAKANRVPVSQRAALWALLRRYFQGQIGIGPRGTFEVA